MDGGLNLGSLPKQPLSLCGLFGLGYASQVAASPDGAIVAVAGSDVIVLLDGASGAELRRVVLPGEHASFLAFSPDASLLAVGDDASIHLVRTADGSPLRTIAAGAALGIAFSPDGLLIVNSTPSAYRVADGTQAWSHAGPFFSAVAPDGSVAMASDVQRHMILLDASTGAVKETGAAVDNSQNPTLTALSPIGLFATVATSGAIELRHPTDTAPTVTLSPTAGVLIGFAFSRDGSRLVATEQGGTVEVWDVASGTAVAKVPVDFPQPFAAALTADGHGLLLLPKRGSVEWMNLDTRTVRFTYAWGHTDALVDARFSPDGREVASVGADGTLRLWDAPTAAQTQVLSPADAGATACAYSPDGASLYVAGGQYVYEYARPGLSVVRQLGPVGSEVGQLEVSPDGTLVVGTESFVGTDVWKTADGSHVLRIPAGAQARSLAIAFSPDSKQLVRVDDLQDLGIYDLSDGSRTANKTATEYGDFEALEFTPAGDRLVVPEGMGLDVLAWPGLDTTATLGPNAAEVWSFAITPGGEQVLSSAGDQSLRLWRLSDGAPIALGTLAGVPTAGHGTMSFAPHDPTRLLVGDWAPRLYCVPPGDAGLIR